MAAAANITALAGHGLRGRLSAMLQQMQENRARRAVYNQTLSELKTLTDRDLSDLGIARSMITRVAYEAAYGTDA